MRTQAIILKKVDIGEYDQLVTCYTRDFGKLRVLTKGYHRPQSKIRGHLDELDLVDCLLIPGKYRQHIRSTLAVSKFSNLSKNPNIFNYALIASELYDKGVLEYGPDSGLWELINTYLTQLQKLTINRTNNGEKRLLSRFLLRFSEINGHPINDLIKNQNLNPYLLSDYLKKEYDINLNSLSFVNWLDYNKS